MSLKKEYMDKQLDCPRCWIPTFRTKIKMLSGNFEIDLCHKCKGIYLDTGELQKMLKNKKLSDYLTKEIGTKSESELVCPRCGGLMDLEFADDIEVDVCLTCNGVWLDEGELDDLKTKSKKGFTPDETEKAVERWEEMVANNRKSSFNKFMRKLGLA